MRRVGWPTPTGTDWPSLPQVPTPPSSFKSLPTMLTRCNTSGPLPINVAPLTGASELAVLYHVGLAGREHEFARGDVHLRPPPKFTAYKPFSTEAMISSGARVPRACTYWSCAAESYARKIHAGRCRSPACPSIAHSSCPGYSPQHALLDQSRALRGRAFIVDVQGSASPIEGCRRRPR